MESLARSLIKFVDQSLKEFFHKSLRSSTNVLAKNIYSDKDTTFKSLNSLRKNNDIVVLAADKESCTVILNKDDYIKKVNDIIDDGIKQMKYDVETTDNTCNELKRFEDLYIVIFINMNIMIRCVQDLINPIDFLQLLRRINLNLSVILLSRATQVTSHY